ncbi:MAG: CBS domain-containing protein [Thermodesulfobacteriota bacterium]|nr:CBS domain-containing protein [Thermodesulfobacteriota bacterium]
MKVQEFMTTRIEFINADGSVYEVIEKMVDKRIRSLLVKLSEKDNDYGVITARDVVFKVMAKSIDPKNVKAREIASNPLVYIDQDMDFNEAATLMKKANISRLIVCDDKKIVGVVAMMDVMSAALIKRARRDYDL